jgi:hypothetical protein
MEHLTCQHRHPLDVVNHPVAALPLLPHPVAAAAAFGVLEEGCEGPPFVLEEGCEGPPFVLASAETNLTDDILKILPIFSAQALLKMPESE